MSDAPERIWTDRYNYWAKPTHKEDKVEYIRADLAPDAAKVAALEAEVARLRKWQATAKTNLGYYADPATYKPDKRYANQPWPIFDDEGALARAALAAMERQG